MISNLMMHLTLHLVDIVINEFCVKDKFVEAFRSLFSVDDMIEGIQSMFHNQHHY